MGRRPDGRFDLPQALKLEAGRSRTTNPAARAKSAAAPKVATAPPATQSAPALPGINVAV